MRLVAIAAFAVLLTGCETSGYGGGGESWGLGPGFVSIGDNKRFGVTYLPDQQAAMLTFTMVGSFSADEQPPEPPIPDEWLAAAQEAAPEGCMVDTLEQVDEENWRAVYECSEAG